MTLTINLTKTSTVMTTWTHYVAFMVNIFSLACANFLTIPYFIAVLSNRALNKRTHDLNLFITEKIIVLNQCPEAWLEILRKKKTCELIWQHFLVSGNIPAV